MLLDLRNLIGGIFFIEQKLKHEYLPDRMKILAKAEKIDDLKILGNTKHRYFYSIDLHSK